MLVWSGSGCFRDVDELLSLLLPLSFLLLLGQLVDGAFQLVDSVAQPIHMCGVPKQQILLLLTHLEMHELYVYTVCMHVLFLIHLETYICMYLHSDTI